MKDVTSEDLAALAQHFEKAANSLDSKVVLEYTQAVAELIDAFMHRLYGHKSHVTQTTEH